MEKQSRIFCQILWIFDLFRWIVVIFCKIFGVMFAGLSEGFKCAFHTVLDAFWEDFRGVLEGFV